MDNVQKSMSVLIIAIMTLSLGSPLGSAHVSTTTGLFQELDNQEDFSGIPPLYCGDEECPEKERFPEFSPIDSSPAVMHFGWWSDFWSDSDSNGFDDRLQMILAGERESVSKTSIIGADGKKTVAIIVHYAWHPGNSDIQ